MKKNLALILVVAMVTGILAGCSSSAVTTNTIASADSTTKIVSEESTVATTKPVEMINVSTSGQNVVQTAVTLIAGEKLGIWSDLGLNVTRTHYVSGPPQLEANPAGDWNIGWIGATAAINGILNYDMVVVGLSGYDYSNMAFVRSDDGIYLAGDKGVAAGTYGTAEEWQGKDIIVGVGTVNYCDLMLTLDALGLTDEDVNIINMDISTGVQAFLAGEGDVIFTSSSYTTTLLETEGIECIHTMKGMDAGMAGSIICTKEYAEANEDALVKYLEGSLEVLLWLNDEANQGQAAEWFSECMLDEFGTEMTADEAVANMKLIGFHDLAFYESLCEVGTDGLTGMQEEWTKFFGYHVTIGSYEASQKEQIISAVDTSYLQKAIDLYKEKNTVSK